MPDGRILIEQVSGVPVVAAPEEIDMANAPDLGSALLEAAADSPGTLVADMTRTRFCAAAGIHNLLAAHKRAQADGGELLLVVPHAAVLRVLAIIGIDRLIPNFTSLDDALAHTSPNGSVSVVPSGSGWTAARIVSAGWVTRYGSGRWFACPSSDLSPGRRPGLAHRVDLIRSLSASWRDPSQICHPVLHPGRCRRRPQTLEGDTRPHDHAGRDSRCRHRDRHPPRQP